MSDWKLMGVEDLRTGEVHNWIARDGNTVDLEDVVGELMEQQQEIERLRERLVAAEAALREIDRLQRAEMYERCPDCDYPTECSRECGCRITERKGTAVQQVVWRTIGREAARAAGGGE